VGSAVGKPIHKSKIVLMALSPSIYAISMARSSKCSHLKLEWVRQNVSPKGYGICLRTRSLGKSLTPRFILINHLHKMIISVKIDCCAETLSELYLIHSFTIKWLTNTIFRERKCSKVHIIIIEKMVKMME